MTSSNVMPPCATTLSPSFVNALRSPAKRTCRAHLQHLLDRLQQEGFAIYLTADHGNVTATGIGNPREGVLVETRGKRARVYDRLEFRDEVKAKFPDSIPWPNYGLPRDRDNRLKVVRDQHFGQLKLVLRTESSNLHEIAVAIKSRAHMSAVVQSEPAGGDAPAMLWPDGLSKDLPRHFPEYDSSKRKLLSDINIQDQEFRDAVLLAEKSIQPSYGLSDRWRELVARSVVDQCTGVGTGIKLTITPDGYHFEHLGGSMSNTGPQSDPPRPSADLVTAFRAFQSLKPDHVLVDHCQSLKGRADMIRNAAEELSKNARAFADGTVLSGACDFIHD